MHAARIAAVTRWMCAILKPSLKSDDSVRSRCLCRATIATEQLRHAGSANLLQAAEATARARRAYHLEPGAILSDHPGATARSHAAYALEMAGRVIEEID
jgi:hypothetical protein